MTPEDFQTRLRVALDEIEIGEETSHAGSRRRAARKLRRRTASFAAVVASAVAVTIVALGLAGLHHGQNLSGPAVSTSPGSSHPATRGDYLRTAAIKGLRVTAGMAAQPGFLVYVGGHNLLGPVVSSTKIEGGNARSLPARNNIPMVASIPGQAFWSPDANKARTRLVFVTGPSGHIGAFAGEGNLVISTITGADPLVVTHSDSDSDPVWSPDGRQIAFLRNESIWLMTAAGTHQHSLGIGLPVHSLAWSPDGKQLAVGSGDSPERIAIVNVKSRTFRWFTPRGVEQYQPAWSPDGTRLVYGQTGPNALFVSNLNGTGARQITVCTPPRCTQDVEPTWSPDGSEVAFVRSVYGIQQIAVVAARGGSVTIVTTGPEQHNLPSW